MTTGEKTFPFQRELNARMSVPLRNIVLDPSIEEALRHSPDVRQLHEMIIRQASALATGNRDHALERGAAKQLLETNTMMKGLYDPVLAVIEDIIKTYGQEAGTEMILRRAAGITRGTYEHLIKFVLSQQ